MEHTPLLPKSQHGERLVRFKYLHLYLTSMTSVLSTFLFGYNTGVISGALLLIKKGFSVSPFMESLLVAIILIGCMLGSSYCGSVSDSLGRRKAILYNNFFFILGPVAMMLAPNFWVLLAGRLVCGVGVGAASVLIPMYLSEIAPPQARGALGMMRQLSVTGGIVVSYMAGYWLMDHVYGWRLMLGIAIIPALAQCIISVCTLRSPDRLHRVSVMPESPRWLVDKHFTAQAEQVMAALDPDLAADPKLLAMQLADIKEQSSAYKVDVEWKELLLPKYRLVLSIGWTLTIFQMITGVNVVVYYAATILQSAGFGEANAILLSVFINIPQLLMISFSIWLVEKVMRRVLLVIGLVGMFIGLGLLGTAFFDQEQLVDLFTGHFKGGESYHPELGKIFSWFAVMGMILYKMCFGMGMGPLPATITAEIFPSRIRGKALSANGVLSWGFNFLMSLSFKPLLNSLGSCVTYWIYAAITVLNILFVIILLPETKGISLEDLQRKLVDKN